MTGALSGEMRPVGRRDVMAAVERDAPGSDAECEQASGGELGGERAGADQPASAGAGGGACTGGSGRGHGATDRGSGLQAACTAGRATARATGHAAAGMNPVADAHEYGGAEAPGQEHRRQRGGKAS